MDPHRAQGILKQTYFYNVLINFMNYIFSHSNASTVKRVTGDHTIYRNMLKLFTFLNI